MSESSPTVAGGRRLRRASEPDGLNSALNSALNPARQLVPRAVVPPAFAPPPRTCLGSDERDEPPTDCVRRIPTVSRDTVRLMVFDTEGTPRLELKVSAGPEVDLLELRDIALAWVRQHYRPVPFLALAPEERRSARSVP